MTFDAYAPSRAYETAVRMLRRYSSPTVAHDMAHWHMCDFPRDSRQWLYWRQVCRLINRLTVPR